MRVDAEANSEKSNDPERRALFVARPLLNADSLIDWAKTEGFRDPIPAAALHVTIALSHQPINWQQLPACNGHLTVPPGRRRLVRNFGGVAALLFGCWEISRRHREFRRIGMGWTHPSYRPHVTFAIAAGVLDDLSAVKPYTGPLLFGPECYREPFAEFSGSK